MVCFAHHNDAIFNLPMLYSCQVNRLLRKAIAPDSYPHAYTEPSGMIAP
ncbi:MAG: hypothetical protein HC772_07315 [Leptolyngbyaceae cyanobacterium CRU_2_3]|nr:hypothetical protein [Leptolyngbyaceae cyanobacterium CRU_2_3]